jgi:hypothetical protein
MIRTVNERPIVASDSCNRHAEEPVNEAAMAFIVQDLDSAKIEKNAGFAV